MSEIDPYAGLTRFPTPTASAAEPESLAKSGLGRDAFLHIFLTQLANQDPLSPQDASQLSAQLATFSQVEQQTLMAEQLRGVNTRLDQLIEAAGGGSAHALDPVALIGRQVQIASSSLQADSAGDSAGELGFEIDRPGVQNLLIAGETKNGKTLGLATLGVAHGSAELARGSYTLRFSDGALALELPDGSTLSGNALVLSPYVVDPASGQLQAVVPGSPGAPDLLRIAPGSTHALTVATRDRQGAYRPLVTHVSGAVSGVRVVDGKQVITVNGADFDPAKIDQVK
jgi:flagellar basal-body rod modification protein FlgD